MFDVLREVFAPSKAAAALFPSAETASASAPSTSGSASNSNSPASAARPSLISSSPIATAGAARYPAAAPTFLPLTWTSPTFLSQGSVDDDDGIAFAISSDEYNGVSIDNVSGLPRPRLRRRFRSLTAAEKDNGM